MEEGALVGEVVEESVAVVLIQRAFVVEVEIRGEVLIATGRPVVVLFFDGLVSRAVSRLGGAESEGPRLVDRVLGNFFSFESYGDFVGILLSST